VPKVLNTTAKDSGLSGTFEMKPVNRKVVTQLGVTSYGKSRVHDSAAIEFVGKGYWEGVKVDLISSINSFLDWTGTYHNGIDRSTGPLPILLQ
jgi:hypothetical protein